MSILKGTLPAKILWMDSVPDQNQLIFVHTKAKTRLKTLSKYGGNKNSKIILLPCEPVQFEKTESGHETFRTPAIY